MKLKRNKIYQVANLALYRLKARQDFVRSCVNCQSLMSFVGSWTPKTVKDHSGARKLTYRPGQIHDAVLAEPV